MALSVCSLLFASTLVGCATYQTKVDAARNALASDNPAKAAELLKPLAEDESRDQLVYLLDYATALQLAKQYKESAQVYQRANQLAEVEDYHSISKVASSLALSEEMVQYKGDPWEVVMINAMNAVNYLELGNLDEALVEVKQLNLKLYKYKTEAKKNYNQNPFAFYLGATIWEAQRAYDDAYIAYKNAYEVAPNYAPLKEDLIRSARLAQRPEEAAKWQAQFPDVKVAPVPKTNGEVILVYEQGWGPRKQSRPENPRFPELRPVYSRTKKARLVVDEKSELSTPIFDVSRTSVKALNDDYLSLVGRRVLGMGTKAVLADQMRQRDKALGAVAWIVLNATDRADVRQWSTLPETFQMSRISVKPGKYKVKVQGLDSYGSPSGEEMPEKEIEVRPGQKVFVTWRSVR